MHHDKLLPPACGMRRHIASPSPLQTIWLLLVSMVLIGCGGTDGDTTNAAAEGERRVMALSSASGIDTDAPGVVQLTQISETRISRTQVEQVFQITVANGSAAQSGLVARLDSAGNGVTIVDGVVAVGDIPAGARVTPGDTITLRFDRQVSTDIRPLAWTLVKGAVTGRIADGYLQGAQVFWDCNNNFIIDSDEPWSESGAGGRYVVVGAPSPACKLRAIVPSWAYDESTKKAVGNQMRMTAMPGQPGFISPLTTVAADAGFDAAELRSRFSIDAPPHEDYVAKGLAGLGTANKAQLLAATLQNVYGVIQSTDDVARAKAVRNYLAYYPPDAFNVPGANALTPAQLTSVLDGLPSFKVQSSMATDPVAGHRFVLRDPIRSGLCGGNVSAVACEQRKTVLRAAIGLIERYDAARGSAIDWSAIPATERRALGLATTIPTNVGVEALRAKMLGLVIRQNALTEDALRVVRGTMRADLANRWADLLIDYADATVTFAGVPAPFKAADKISFKKVKKALLHLRDNKDGLLLVGVSARCLAVVTNDLVDLNLENDSLFVDIGKLSELALGTLGCWTDLFKNKRVKQAMAIANGAKDVVWDGADLLSARDQQIRLWKGISAVLGVGTAAAEVLDVGGGRVVGSIKLLAVVVDGWVAGLEFGISADKAIAQFQTLLDNQRKDFELQIAEYGTLFYAARVEPYIVADVYGGYSLRPYFARPAPLVQAQAVTTPMSRQAAAESANHQTTAGEELQFSPLAVDSGASPVGETVWDFGDGSPLLRTNSGAEVTHAYRTAGRYVVTVSTNSRSSPLWFQPGTQAYGAQQEMVVQVLAASSTTQRLADTGATHCLRAGLAFLVACDSPEALALSDRQDGMLGRDAVDPNPADGRNGFSYAEVPGFGRDECIVDRATGLMWEGKTAAGWRAGPNFYLNRGVGDYIYADGEDVRDYVVAVNSSGLCGHRDWRLPEVDELLGLIDYGQRVLPPATNYSADPAWFPNSSPVPNDAGHRIEWAATPCVRRELELCIWLLDNNGTLSYAFPHSRHARLVRGRMPLPLTRFAPSVDGREVLDRATSLIWSRCLEGMTWEATAATCVGAPMLFDLDEAFGRARTSSLTSARSWRLPNIKELSSLADRARARPAMVTAEFPVPLPYPVLWSSTPELTSSTIVRTLSLLPDTGQIQPRTRINAKAALRLVRGD